jgi:hypothetical protein
MELVTIVEIELCRPQSASHSGFSGSNPVSGIFVIANEDVASLKEAVLDFAEKCGVSRRQLQGLRQISNYQYSPDNRVMFDIETRNVQYSTPYAMCRATPALKIGSRYFNLSEISGVSQND